jgi:hypothetical protein
VLVDLAGHGDAADPVDGADAGVEDARAVGQEGVGRALHAAAPALLPVRDHVAAVAAAVEGVQEVGPVQAGLGGQVGQGGPPSSPATFSASMAGSRVEGQVSRRGGEKWSGSSWVSTGISWLRVSQGVPRSLTSSSGQQRQATGGWSTLALARRRRIENT